MTDTPTAQERTLESDRKVFDSVINKYRGKGSRDERPIPQPPEAQSPPSPDPTITTEAEPQQTQAAPVETPAPSQDPTSRKTAEEFLRLKTGSPASVFEGMSDEAVLAWAEERRTRESSVDGVYRRAAEAERELKDLHAAQVTKAAEPKGPTHAEDLDAAKKKVVEELSLTDEGRDALERRIELEVKPLRDELTKRDELAKEATSKRIIKAVDHSRAELSKRFAQLAADETFLDVFDEMARLEGSPRFAGSGRTVEEYTPELMTAVARSFGLTETDPERVAAAQEAAQEELHDRVAGGVSVADTQTAPVTPSKESNDRAVFNEIRKRSLAKRGAVG